MTATDADLAAPAGRPIELPTTETAARGAPAPSDGETAAQSRTEEPAEALGEDDANDALPDYRGEPFDHDMGGSFAPVVLFAVLTGLAVLLGVYATTALVVQIGAGAVAVGAATLAVRAMARRRRSH